MGVVYNNEDEETDGKKPVDPAFLTPDMLGKQLRAYLGQGNPLESKVQNFIDRSASLTDAAKPGITALNTAVVHGHTKIVALLLKNNACPESPDAANRTALMYAEKVEIARILVNGGAKIDAVDNYGRTPLHHFAVYGRWSLVKLMLQSGSQSLNVQDSWGGTPLRTSLLQGNFEIAQYLLAQPGIDPTIKSYDGLSMKDILLGTELAEKRAENPQIVDDLVIKIQKLETAFNVSAVRAALAKPVAPFFNRPKLKLRQQNIAT